MEPIGASAASSGDFQRLYHSLTLFRSQLVANQKARHPLSCEVESGCGEPAR